MSLATIAAFKISASRAEIAEEITRLHYEKHPELEARYGPIGRKRCLEDADYHLSYLAEALEAGQSGLFAAYSEWAREMLQARGIPVEDLRENFKVLREALAKMFPDVAPVISEYVEEALEALSVIRPSQSFLRDSEPLADLAAGYLRASLRMDRHGARRLIFDALENPQVTVGQIYRHVFEKTQREIGRLWQLNEISVGQEHYCTAVTQSIMAEMYPRVLGLRRNGKRAIVVCASGDLHELGARMVSDHLEIEGWETIYLGANTPVASILQMVREHKPDLLAISVAITVHITGIRELIRQIRADRSLQTRIMVGGYPFLVAPALWRELGADGFAPDAASAVKLAGELVAAA